MFFAFFLTLHSAISYVFNDNSQPLSQQKHTSDDSVANCFIDNIIAGAGIPASQIKYYGIAILIIYFLMLIAICVLATCLCHYRGKYIRKKEKVHNITDNYDDEKGYIKFLEYKKRSKAERMNPITLQDLSSDKVKNTSARSLPPPTTTPLPTNVPSNETTISPTNEPSPLDIDEPAPLSIDETIDLPDVAITEETNEKATKGKKKATKKKTKAPTNENKEQPKFKTIVVEA